MKRLLIVAAPIAIGILGGIGIAANNGSKTSPTSTTNQAPISAKPSPTDNPAQVAKETCGDSGSADNWYPVFIDGGNLAEIQAKFCKDAIAKTREKNGKPTVQLASFSDRTRAEKFAKSVGGEVGEAYSVAAASTPVPIAPVEPDIKAQPPKTDGERFAEEMEKYLSTAENTKYARETLRTWRRGNAQFRTNDLELAMKFTCESKQEEPDPDRVALTAFEINERANPLSQYQTFNRAKYHAAQVVAGC
ncbi:MAG: hypothetical protein J0L70_28740 [Leptolyngbya sp. UWPOB_LEPTO1]|uniref:hypothetical protein n=1 Tax=Leptolyngbya sp. UWPOB_LEPTO1 TaxID=2815653 RepID=UPI001AD2B6BC|nr:hypothetical protein [Leptolyngbya sp. UWPOB_LEPTO1]MBN8564524.1 hypothetical protein [Leptolyngbya sp. UWPOB_LEPTO1]